MSGQLRALHVIASLSPKHGGTTTAVLDYMQALTTAGVACEVLATDDDGPGARLAQDAPERALPGRHYVPKARDFYAFAPGMGAALQGLLPRFDLVHIHGLFAHANGVAGAVCRRAGVPYVVTPHGMANRYGLAHKPWRKRLSMALVERPLLRGAATVHLTSGAEAADFQALGLGCTTRQVPLPVVPAALGTATRFLGRWPALRGRKIVLFLGRLNPVKNVEALIGAAALAAQADPSVALVIAGEGDPAYRAALESRAQTAGLTVCFTGFLSGTKKADALAAACVFVLPSHSESFGLAAVEALGAGLPVVLSEGVAVGPDLHKEGLAQIGPPHPQGLARALSAALDTLPQWQPERARAHVAQAFAPAAVAQQLAAVYQHITRGQNAPGRQSKGAAA